MTKPVALTPTYGAQSGTVAMSLFDGTFGQVQAALNDYSTYAVYAVDVGAASALVVNTGSVTYTLATGVALDVLVAATNTGATTLNVSGTGVITVLDATGAALTAGTLTGGTIYRIVYDGTSYRALGTLAASGGVGPGAFTSLSASGAVSGAGFVALHASPGPIGSTTASTGAFTTISGTTITAKNLTVTPTAGASSFRAVAGSHSLTIADSQNGGPYNAGYLSTPQSSSTTLALTDRGKTVVTVAGTVTIPAGIFSGGDVICVHNNSTSNGTITPAAGVTLYLAGTNTGGVAISRTLGTRSLATLYCIANNNWLVAGSVVS